MIYNPLKYVCIVFKPDRFSLKCPLVHFGNTVLEYQEKVKHLGVLLNDNLNDNDDIMKHMRGLYARANSVLRKFAACCFDVKLRRFCVLEYFRDITWNGKHDSPPFQIVHYSLGNKSDWWNTEIDTSRTTR